MEDLCAAKAAGLDCIHQIKSKLVEAEDLQTYDKFKNVLQKYGNREIHSSTAVYTVQNLFKNYPDLLHLFKSFIPANYKSAADAKEAADLQTSIDFMKRVRDRFHTSYYRKILDCFYSFSRGELSVSMVCNNVVKLLGPHKDLAAEFVSFVPEYTGNIQETSRKRKISSICDKNVGFQEPPRKKRVNGRYKTGPEIEDFDMEDSLAFVEVQISNMDSTYEKAVDLMWLLVGGNLSPADVRLENHFSQLNLACIRQLYKEFFISKDKYLLSAVSELTERLERKTTSLEKSKAALKEKLKDKWLKIRQHRRFQDACKS